MATPRRRRAAALLGAVLIVLLGACGDEESATQPAARGDLELAVAYAGTLGTVSLTHPLVAHLYPGANPFATGGPVAIASGAHNPDTLRFTDLEAGDYTLWVYYDYDLDGLSQPRPYELYADCALGETPTLLPVSVGETTAATVVFDDRFLLDPWEPLVAFALPDSNPQSPTYGTTLTEAGLAGQPALLYVAATPVTRLPFFALRDINPNSPTEGERIASVDLLGGPFVIYFGSACCSGCRSRFAGLDLLVWELQQEGLAEVTGMMVSYASEQYPCISYIEDLDVPLPALQDTLTGEVGALRPAVTSQLVGVSGNWILVVDADGYEIASVSAYDDHDPRTATGRAAIQSYLREGASSERCGGCGSQPGGLVALHEACATAGLTGVHTLILARFADGCQRRALQAAAGELPILEDALDGWAAASAAQPGELLLIDAAGRVRQRIRVGGEAQDDLDLTLAEDRDRVVAWLEAIGAEASAPVR